MKFLAAGGSVNDDSGKCAFVFFSCVNEWMHVANGMNKSEINKCGKYEDGRWKKTTKDNNKQQQCSHRFDQH